MFVIDIFRGAIKVSLAIAAAMAGLFVVMIGIAMAWAGLLAILEFVCK